MAPPEYPSDREFGEKLGEMRGEMQGIGRRLDELAESNAREHRENGERMERFAAEMREVIADKASKAWVQKHEDRLSEVEGKWREGKGALRLANVGKGIFIAVTPFLVYLLFEKGVG